MPTYAEIIARAETLAQGTGLDPSQSPVIDGTMTAEAIYPHAVRYAIHLFLKSGKSVADFTQDHLIEIVNGEGTLPDSVVKISLAKTAFIVGDKFSSYLAHQDYIRTLFIKLCCYFSVRNNKFFYSCEPQKIVKTITGVNMNAGEDTIFKTAGLSLTDDDIGRRVRVTDGTIVSIDSVLDGEVDSQTWRVRGRALATITDDGATAYIYENTNEVLVRTVPNISCAEDDNEVSSSTEHFLSTDVARRIKVYDGSDLIVDAFGDEWINNTDPTEDSLKVRANAVQSAVGGASAEIYYSGVRLNAVTVPTPPSNPATDSGLSAEMADRVIEIIAAVLKGEMPLSRLIEYEN